MPIVALWFFGTGAAWGLVAITKPRASLRPIDVAPQAAERDADRVRQRGVEEIVEQRRELEAERSERAVAFHREAGLSPRPASTAAAER